MLLKTKQILLAYICVQYCLQYTSHWSLMDMIRQLKKLTEKEVLKKKKTVSFSVLKKRIKYLCLY